jgi:hypothetical protein
MAAVTSASGAEHGALFTYTVEKPFSLAAHSSALVPLFQKSVDVEALAWFADAGSPARSAVRFTNSTGQTLPSGTLAVLASGGFAGESGLDRLKPGEHRFIQFGNELDAEVSEKKREATEASKHLTFTQGDFEEHFLRNSRITYELENRSTSARPFYVGIPLERNATLAGADGVDFDEAQAQPIAVFQMPPKQKQVRTVESSEGLSHHTPYMSLTQKQLDRISQQGALPSAELAIAREVRPLVKEAEAAQQASNLAETEIGAVQTEVERFREHLKALGGDKGGAGSAAAPLVKRLLEAEDRLAAATKRRNDRASDVKTRWEAVRVVLAKLPEVK